MDGMVDNVAIFNSELTSAQIKALHDDPLGTNSIFLQDFSFWWFRFKNF